MMKNNKIILFLLAASLFYSCEDELRDPVLSISGSPTITAPSSGGSYLIEENTLQDLFPEFQWSSADYGFEAGVSYNLEMDLTSANFSAPVSLGKVNKNSFIVDNAKINSIMLQKDAKAKIPTDVSFRIIASINPDVDDLISAPITASITPFEVAIEYPKLHVPGNYQGWDPANETTVVFSINSDDVYEGFIYMSEPNSAYKFTVGTTWDVNYGDTGADGVLDAGGDDILATSGAGMYKLNVDLNDLSFSQEKVDWGLIGSSTPTGWDSDTDLVYDIEKNTSSITLDLVAGAIKFRANDDWAINLGDTDADLVMEYGGDDILIEDAGNYTIELLLNQAAYTYLITKNE